jgi:hypothetical protein
MSKREGGPATFWDLEGEMNSRKGLEGIREERGHGGIDQVLKQACCACIPIFAIFSNLETCQEWEGRVEVVQVLNQSKKIGQLM